MREWSLRETCGTCVIWCKEMTFGNIVTVVVGIRVIGILCQSGKWILQATKCWTDISWNNEKAD